MGMFNSFRSVTHYRRINGIRDNTLGFTLAEVLITLGIIGIVAAMTIPTLMNNIQDVQYKTAFKKAYSEINSAYNLIATENGGQFADSISACVDTNANCIRDVFKQKLSYIKECNTHQTVGYCFPASTDIYYLNGNKIDYVLDDGGGLILKNGSSLNFGGGVNSCNVYDNWTGLSKTCGWIYVDTNGLKKPNTWGKDIYRFIIDTDKIYPFIPHKATWAPSADDCGTGNNYGFTCSSKYLAE